MKHSLTLAVVAILLPSLLWAQSTGIQFGGLNPDDSDAPVEVTSDQLEVDQVAGTALFSGDVLVIQGELRLAAPKILVTYTRLPDGSVGSDVDTITASGGVLMVTPEEAAEAQEAVYSPIKEEVIMTGDVLLTQGPNTLNGARLVIDLVTGSGKMDGRVRTVLTPGSEPDTADGAAQ